MMRSSQTCYMLGLLHASPHLHLALHRRQPLRARRRRRRLRRSCPFETKMSWILRLEDQRILRDAAMPIVPPPVTAGQARTSLPPPPPPPDLVRLLERWRGAHPPPRRDCRRPRRDCRRPCRRSSGCCRPTRIPKCGRWRRSRLGLIGDQSAVEPLRAAVADPLPLVAGRAAEALGLHRRHRVGARDRQDGGGSRRRGRGRRARRQPRAEMDPARRRVQARRVRAGAAEKLRRARGVACSAPTASRDCSGGRSRTPCSASKTSARFRRC